MLKTLNDEVRQKLALEQLYDQSVMDRVSKDVHAVVPSDTNVT